MFESRPRSSEVLNSENKMPLYKVIYSKIRSLFNYQEQGALYKQVLMLQKARENAQKITFVEDEDNDTNLRESGSDDSYIVHRELIADNSEKVTMHYTAQPNEVICHSFDQYIKILDLSLKLQFSDWSSEDRAKIVDERARHELKHLKSIIKAADATPVFGIRYIIQEKKSKDGVLVSREAIVPFASFIGTIDRQAYLNYLRGGDDEKHSPIDRALRELLDN